ACCQRAHPCGLRRCRSAPADSSLRLKRSGKRMLPGRSETKVGSVFSTRRQHFEATPWLAKMRHAERAQLLAEIRERKFGGAPETGAQNRANSSRVIWAL